VRQLTNSAGGVTFAKAYDPYGNVTQVNGEGQSAYGYTGEQQSNDMVYLRARYYNSANGRFQSRDTWGGDDINPITLNRWAYANANPIRYTDPSGNSVTQSIISTALRRAGIGSAPGGSSGYGIECASTGDAALGDFWLGFWKEAYRVHIWFNPFPSVQKDVAIKSNESSSMLLGRLTADIVSIAVAYVEMGTADLLFMAGPAECIAGLLAAGVGEFITCPGAALQMAGALVLGGQAVVSGSIAVVGGVQILAMLRGRNGSGGGGGDGGSSGRVPSVNQMNQEIKRGSAPKGINRVDKPLIPFEKYHVHFDDGSALNIDGTWKHGQSALSSAQVEWLLKYGWTIP